MSLVGHWKFQDSAASTTVVATAGANGTLNGGDNTVALSAVGPGGAYLHSLHLNGSDDRIATTTNWTNLSSAFTLSAWVNVDDISAARGIFGSQISNSYLLALGSSGSVDCWVGGTTAGTNRVTSATGVVAVSEWTHIAATWDGTTLTLWVNATSVASDNSLTLSFAAGDTWIGTWRAGFFFDGRLADVRIYDNSLTQADIQAVMDEASLHTTAPALHATPSAHIPVAFSPASIPPAIIGSMS